MIVGLNSGEVVVGRIGDDLRMAQRRRVVGIVVACLVPLAGISPVP